jgi:calcineurin-like phosphoesterase
LTPNKNQRVTIEVQEAGTRVRILFIGDIFGRPGRTIVKDRLPGLVREHAIDLVIANGENSAAGFGITPPLAEDLFELGIDVIITDHHLPDEDEGSPPALAVEWVWPRSR